MDVNNAEVTKGKGGGRKKDVLPKGEYLLNRKNERRYDECIKE